MENNWNAFKVLCGGVWKVMVSCHVQHLPQAVVVEWCLLVGFWISVASCMSVEYNILHVKSLNIWLDCLENTNARWALSHRPKGYHRNLQAPSDHAVTLSNIMEGLCGRWQPAGGHPCKVIVISINLATVKKTMYCRQNYKYPIPHPTIGSIFGDVDRNS